MKKTPANSRSRRKAAKKRPVSRMTLLVLAALTAALCIQILRMGGQIKEALAEEAVVAQQLAELQAANQSLQDDLDNSTDPTLIENIARDQLGMVREGEKIFHISK